MKKLLLSLILTTTLSTYAFSQTTLVGAEPYSVSVPQDFTRTTGNNDLATVQWENLDKGIYGYVFFEHKDELTFNEVQHDLESYANIMLENYSYLKDYKLINSKKYKNANGYETVQKEFKYYDEDNELKYHMIFNVFQSKDFNYFMINYAEDGKLNPELKDVEYIINNIKIP